MRYVEATATLDQVTPSASDEIWIVRNGAIKKVLVGNIEGVALSQIGSSEYSYLIGGLYGTIDTTVQAGLASDGTSSFPNKIGVNNTKPVSEPAWGSRTADSAYVAGTADIAIALGYDNVVNALAGVAISMHGMIYSGATHASIWGGSLHTIMAGSDYAAILGGSSNLIEADCDYGIIVGGDGNTLEDGASFPTDYGHRGVIIGGTSNISSGQFGTVISGSGNSATGQKSTVINGVSSTASGLHATAFGNGCTASGAYSLAGGVSSVASGARAIAWGDSHSVTHDYATARGSGCVSPHHGAQTFASRQRGGTAGRNQAVEFQCSQETTDTTTTRLSLAGSSTYPTQPENSIVAGFAIVVGVSDAGVSSSFQIDFHSERIGSGTATLRQNSTTTKYNGLALGTVPTMNVTTGGIYRVQVVGLAATNIWWDARIFIEQTIFA